MTQKNRIFFQIKIFDISFFFFAKVRQEYQNILSWLFKNHHRRSICLAVLLQEHFQKAHFNIGHPVRVTVEKRAARRRPEFNLSDSRANEQTVIVGLKMDTFRTQTY